MVRKWNNKPLLRVCDKCLSYDHDRNRCPVCKVRCAICAGTGHHEDNHEEKCAPCKKMIRPEGHVPPPPPKGGACATAGQKKPPDHLSTPPKSPLRANSRAPAVSFLAAGNPEDMEHD